MIDPYIRDARQRYREIITPPSRLPGERATGKMVERAARDEVLLRWLHDLGVEVDIKTIVALVDREKPRGSWVWPKSDREAGTAWRAARNAARKAGCTPPPPPDRGPPVEQPFTLSAKRTQIQRQLDRLCAAGLLRRRKEGRRFLYSLSTTGKLFVVVDRPLIFEVNKWRAPTPPSVAVRKGPNGVEVPQMEAQNIVHGITTYDNRSATGASPFPSHENEGRSGEDDPLRDDRDEVSDHEIENPLRDDRDEAGLNGSNGSLHDAPLDDKGFYSELRRRLEAIDRRDSEPRDSNGKDETNEERDPLRIFSSWDRE